MVFHYNHCLFISISIHFSLLIRSFKQLWSHLPHRIISNLKKIMIWSSSGLSVNKLWLQFDLFWSSSRHSLITRALIYEWSKSGGDQTTHNFIFIFIFCVPIMLIRWKILLSKNCFLRQWHSMLTNALIRWGVQN